MARSLWTLLAFAIVVCVTSAGHDQAPAKGQDAANKDHNKQHTNKPVISKHIERPLCKKHEVYDDKCNCCHFPCAVGQYWDLKDRQCKCAGDQVWSPEENKCRCMHGMFYSYSSLRCECQGGMHWE